MCIIAYKPENVDFPTYDTLQECWNRNKDGAGYMFPFNKYVIIRKGFMTFEDFIVSLSADVKQFGNKIPYIMHFRITTQGGVQQSLTHPFTLSKNMDDLKLLQSKSKIGIAHNGIISLTKSYSTTDHSDTMEFITDYLSLIVKSKYFYKDEDTLELIERLCKSRLAIMDDTGHVTLIGDFVTDEESGCIYSNTSYKESRYITTYIPPKETKTETKDTTDLSDVKKIFECCKGSETMYENDSRYRFIPKRFCPALQFGCKGYCGNCMFKDECKNGGK